MLGLRMDGVLRVGVCQEIKRNVLGIVHSTVCAQRFQYRRTEYRKGAWRHKQRPDSHHLLMTACLSLSPYSAQQRTSAGMSGFINTAI